MLRINSCRAALLAGVGAVALGAAVIVPAVIAPDEAAAHGWPYHSLDEPLGQFNGVLSKTRDYISRGYQNVRYKVSQIGGPRAVLVMKLGMGIPYCKGHSATIGVRDGKYFRPVARTRTLRGVRARNIGLMAVTLVPGTYYIVHGRCHVGGRVHNIGQPVRRVGARRIRSGPRLFRTSYAKFTIKASQVLNGGFLRFFPARGRRLRIRLQQVPRNDLRFLAARFPDLSQDLERRLMLRTNRAGYALKRIRPTRKKRTPLRKARITPVIKEIGKEPKDIDQPLIRLPNSTPSSTGAENSVQNGASDRPHNETTAISGRNPVTPVTPVTPVVPYSVLNPLPKTSGTKPAITAGQRSAACKALLQLKREGKVRQLPVTCLRFGLRKSNETASGLPPAIGKDK